MKHKHYDMIVAKAANTELAVFYRYENDEWEEAASEMLVWDVKAEHFLCLPQHKEAVLEGLNGGNCQFLPPVDGDREWADSENHHFETWSDDWWYMDNLFESRIKPKKEKRWIGVHPLGRTTPLGKTKKFVSDIVLHQMIDVVMPFSEWQFIEIEVEV